MMWEDEQGVAKQMRLLGFRLTVIAYSDNVIGHFKEKHLRLS